VADRPIQAASRPRAVRALLRLAALPAIAAATALVLFDDLFRAWVVPAVRRLARLRLMRRLEAWIAGLPRYGVLALFIVPLAIIEPFKIVALYLIAHGHWLMGLATFVLAKVVGIGLVERLFAIGRAKLLSIGWFRWAHERVIRVRDAAHDRLVRSPLWWALSERLRQARARLAALRRGLTAFSMRSRQWAALRRLARRRLSGGAAGRRRP
jgi:hypothetical protein